ncbi:MAG TPA: aldo/keto reductase [Pyrinomonadaceae bacterium]|nr:aldo/keto reductase [Pyrinomonadaceae bacterium]
MKTVKLPSGELVPALGQGTWNMGDKKRERAHELAALRLGLDFGMTLIDTAEMYGDGNSEELIAEAIEGRREEVFLVSKVLPQNATNLGTIKACEGSLRRLKTDRLDLYLLHWREKLPLEGTLSGCERLVQDGKIRYWGVSNFDVADMEELEELSGGSEVTTNQVLYNLTRRGIEFDLMPWCRERNVPIMAYSPIEQGRLLKKSALKKIASRHGVTPSQVALAWVLRHDDVIAIPKAAKPEHVQDNHGALDLRLSTQDFLELDEAFPPPSKRVPLETM